MFNVGGMEFFVILLVALLVIGPTKLPQAARQVGQFIGEFRRIASGFQDELKSAIDDTPLDTKPKAKTFPKEKAKSAGGPTVQAAAVETTSAEQSDEDAALEMVESDAVVDAARHGDTLPDDVAPDNALLDDTVPHDAAALASDDSAES